MKNRPNVAEIDAFLADTCPDAKLADGGDRAMVAALLASWLAEREKSATSEG